jgi:hypothetical protein
MGFTQGKGKFFMAQSNAQTSFSFTQLTEPAQYASPTAPGNFNAAIAYFLGQCCALTYDQYAQDALTLTAAQLATLGPGYTVKQIGTGISTSEPIGLGTVVGEAGYYRTVPVGFCVNVTPNSGPAFNVIALRGTQSFMEWIDDLSAIPSSFLVGDNGGNYYSKASFYPLGMVHGGFLKLYNAGTNGALPQKLTHDIAWYSYTRPDGSISAQIATLATQLDSSLPLYITGHSLGAALAILCAMDFGVNFSSSYAAGQLRMYNLAGPRVAAGLTTFDNIGSTPADFISAYTAVVNESYLIVNAADLVPIVPPSAITLSEDLSIAYGHVVTPPLSFLAQTGDIGGNHSCAGTYVPYLQQLAGGFQS